MKRTVTIVAVALALAATACAEPDAGASDDTTTTVPATTETTTTSIAAPPDTVATTTTTTSDPTTSSDLEELLDSLVAPGEAASGRMEGLIEMTGLDPAEAGVEEVRIVFAAAHDAASGDSSFLIDMSSLAGAVPSDDEFSALAGDLIGTMEFRQVGDRAYMNAPFFNLLFGAETAWISMPAEDGDDFSSGFEQVPADPSDVMESYEGADATVENLGQETVNGVTTTHYRVTFDTSAWIDELSADELAELRESGVFADGLLPMDLWVSAEGHLIRMLLEISADQADAGADAGFQSMTVRWDMYDIGGPVSIEPPPPADVTDVEDLQFFDLDFDFDFEASA